MPYSPAFKNIVGRRRRIHQWHDTTSILLAVKRDTPCTSILLVVKRNIPCTSILLTVKRDTPSTSILLAVKRDTPCTSILLAVKRDTPCTSILLAVKRDTPCTTSTPHCFTVVMDTHCTSTLHWWCVSWIHPARPYSRRWKEIHPAPLQCKGGKRIHTAHQHCMRHIYTAGAVYGYTARPHCRRWKGIQPAPLQCWKMDPCTSTLHAMEMDTPSRPHPACGGKGTPWRPVLAVDRDTPPSSHCWLWKEIHPCVYTVECQKKNAPHIYLLELVEWKTSSRPHCCL